MLRKKCRKCTKNVWILAVIQCTCIASFTFISVIMVLHCIYNTELTWLLKYSLFKYMYSFFGQICSFFLSQKYKYIPVIMTLLWQTSSFLRRQLILEQFVYFKQMRKQGKLNLQKHQKLGMPALHALYFPNANFQGKPCAL